MIFVGQRQVLIYKTLNVKCCVVGVQLFRLFRVIAEWIFFIFCLIFDSTYRLGENLLYKFHVLPFVLCIHNAVKVFFLLELVGGCGTENSCFKACFTCGCGCYKF